MHNIIEGKTKFDYIGEMIELNKSKKDMIRMVILFWFISIVSFIMMIEDDDDGIVKAFVCFVIFNLILLFIREMIQKEIKKCDFRQQLLTLHDELPLWKREENGLRAGNILIYYNEKFKEWRIKDTSMTGSYSMMDISSIEYPFTDLEIARIKSIASNYHKSQYD